MGGEGERGELREEVKGRGEENEGEKRGERRKRKTSLKNLSLYFSFKQQGSSTEEARPHKQLLHNTAEVPTFLLSRRCSRCRESITVASDNTRLHP